MAHHATHAQTQQHLEAHGEPQPGTETSTGYTVRSLYILCKVAITPLCYHPPRAGPNSHGTLSLGNTANSPPPPRTPLPIIFFSVPNVITGGVLNPVNYGILDTMQALAEYVRFCCMRDVFGWPDQSNACVRCCSKMEELRVLTRNSCFADDLCGRSERACKDFEKEWPAPRRSL